VFFNRWSSREQVARLLLENVYAKLGVKGRGELAAFVHDVFDRQLL
jgi:hypothetical protein